MVSPTSRDPTIGVPNGVAPTGGVVDGAVILTWPLIFTFGMAPPLKLMTLCPFVGSVSHVSGDVLPILPTTTNLKVTRIFAPVHTSISGLQIGMP